MSLMLAIFNLGCVSEPVIGEPPVLTAVIPAISANLVTVPATFTAVPTVATTATPPATARPLQKPIPTATLQIPAGYRRTIGFSTHNRPIHTYQFGNGPNTVVFVGGIHGGYEWNTILLAYAAIDYFLDHPQMMPAQVKLFIIPSANPDGQALVVGQDGRFTTADIPEDTFPGRFNGNGVDLNRNWDCDWLPTAVWRDEPVSAGREPFSEPESRALRDFLLAQQPTAVIFWHSAANGVYPSDCGQPFPASLELAELYSAAANYPLRPEFTSYTVTGDAGNWLATQNIPAITVELKSSEVVEWEQNLAGITAVLQSYMP
ncbi:MAG: hypothetical protein H6658_13145 [Ardenticatenaceae bacterium]|nr:hypothetical protein [Ardenticatenaceae bacterium]